MFPPIQNSACSSGPPRPCCCVQAVALPLYQYSPISFFPFPCCSYNSSPPLVERSLRELCLPPPVPVSVACLCAAPWGAGISATPNTSRTPSFYFPRPSLHCCCMTPVSICVPSRSAYSRRLLPLLPLFPPCMTTLPSPRRAGFVRLLPDCFGRSLNSIVIEFVCLFRVSATVSSSVGGCA